jgi:hypothetical protein
MVQRLVVQWWLVGSLSSRDRNAGPEPGEPAARSFCEGLSQTLGPAYRVSLYRRDPPDLVHAWGAPSPTNQPDDVISLLRGGVEHVLNHPGGRGTRVSLLALPSPNAHARFSVAIEADTRGLARAARLLSAMAQPTGQTEWPGESGTHLGEALDRMMTAAEDVVGVPIPDMSRSQKQRVVKYLDDRGAFLIKKAVEDVAVRLGVSRFTIYNYLDEANRSDPRPRSKGVS